MTIALLSDIHGNLPALEAVTADAERQHVSAYLLGGDLFIGAPFVLETLELIQQIGALTVQGNHEEYLLALDDPHRSAEKHTGARWGAMRWAYQRLGQTGLDYVRGLEKQAVFAPPGFAPVRMVHGSPRSCREGLVPDQNPPALTLFRQAHLWPYDQEPPILSQSLAGIVEPVLVCGHTHIPWQQQVNEHRVVNPGSVGLPIHGSWKAQYALLNWDGQAWQVQPRSLPYDRERARKAYFTSGLLEQGGAFARACLGNLLSGQNTAWFLILHVQAYLRAQGKTLDGITDADWTQAVENFPWAHYGV